MQPKRNLINELYFQLKSIRGVTESMTNMCVAYTLPDHAEAQIHGIEQSIIALTEKADKLVTEIDTQAACGIDEPELCKQASADDTKVPWSYWQDDVCEIRSLISASLNLSDLGDNSGAHVVLNQAAIKANFLNDYMDIVNTGNAKGDVIVSKSLEAVA